MTSREGTPHIYAPTLHRELLQRHMPEGVLFLDPGLPQTAERSGLFHPKTYPLTSSQAASVLAELLTIGEALDVATRTGSQTARALFADADDTTYKKKVDIARSATQSSSSANIHAGIVAAQKVLLLAWDLEERLAEINRLRREIAEMARPLAENLHGPAQKDVGEFSDLGFPDIFVGEHSFSNFNEADWRLTLTAMAAFLPEGATLVTAHPDMRAAMLEAGMLLPLPEDVALRLTGWPEQGISTLLWTKAPLWRILGRSREPVDAPWLLAAQEVIVCR